MCQIVFVGDADRATRSNGGLTFAERDHSDATETANRVSPDAATKPTREHFKHRKFVPRGNRDDFIETLWFAVCGDADEHACQSADARCGVRFAKRQRLWINIGEERPGSNAQRGIRENGWSECWHDNFGASDCAERLQRRFDRGTR